MSRIRVALVVLCDALLIAAVVILFEIDKLVNKTLYLYGLNFSHDWADPYWLFLRVTLILIIAAVVILSLVELPHPAFEDTTAT